MKNSLVAIVLLIFAALDIAAQDRRPITSVYSLEVGSASLLDTYLSPVKTHGVSTALTGRWSKALPCNPTHLDMHFNGRLQAYRATNHGANPLMSDLGAEFFWGLDWHSRLPLGIRYSLGGEAGIHGAGIMTQGTSNNPANADVWAGLSLTASLTYPFHIRRLPVVVSDNVSLPSFGAFFAPQYAEPYYEIWLGNRHDIVHCGWWGNRFDIDNMLSADLLFGDKALRIGYRFRCESQWAAGNNRRVITHAVAVGVVFNANTLKP